MLKFFSAIAMGFVLLFSQMPIATQLYTNRDISLYENELTQQAFADYSYSKNNKIPVKILGITVKNINVKEDKKVYLGGQTVGIAMYTEGLLVTDIISVENENSVFLAPAQDAGIKKGDYILTANGIKLDDVSNIDAVLRGSNGEKVKKTVFTDLECGCAIAPQVLVQ